VSSFPHDDNHRVLLSNDRGGDTIHLLVVPPDTDPGQAHEAMTTAASRGNARSATSLLTEADDQQVPRTHLDACRR